MIFSYPDLLIYLFVFGSALCDLVMLKTGFKDSLSWFLLDFRASIRHYNTKKLTCSLLACFHLKSAFRDAAGLWVSCVIWDAIWWHAFGTCRWSLPPQSSLCLLLMRENIFAMTFKNICFHFQRIDALNFPFCFLKVICIFILVFLSIIIWFFQFETI